MQSQSWMVGAVMCVTVIQISRAVASSSSDDKILILLGQPQVSFQQCNHRRKAAETTFLLLAEAESDPASKPLVLWLNGGPGCSSFGVGAFSEHGSFTPGDGGLLVRNDYSWNKEYGLDVLVSTKIDVYSFGIMLMELLTRKKPTNEMFKGEMSLKRLVKESLPDSVIDIVDSKMLNRGDGYSVNKDHYVTSIMELALQCTKESPEERINMVEILASLKKIEVEFIRDPARRGP